VVHKIIKEAEKTSGIEGRNIGNAVTFICCYGFEKSVVLVTAASTSGR
jgi:hypothetical protein